MHDAVADKGNLGDVGGFEPTRVIALYAKGDVGHAVHGKVEMRSWRPKRRGEDVGNNFSAGGRGALFGHRHDHVGHQRVRRWPSVGNGQDRFGLGHARAECDGEHHGCDLLGFHVLFHIPGCVLLVILDFKKFCHGRKV
ncbi:hypothetical protein [uncultured Celeribacter sp.]|uniref:hypothetical protein n=1 Tax=uncultured Celeribacter sp. TaxID=1303376 RepID=UPI002AA725DC|nr:hypothetical protein [uncultured Celeribacter sp.]